MSGYRKRPDRLADPGPLLGRLRSCRDDLIRESTGVRPFGIIYHGLSMVVVAIDALATLLSGQERYFEALGGGSTAGQRAAGIEKLAREGEDDS